MIRQDLIDKLQLSASGFVGNLLQGVVDLAILVLILLVGAFVANLLGMVLKRFLVELRLEKFLESHGIHDALLGFSVTNVAVLLLKLYVMIVFLGIAADIVMVPMLSMLAAQATGYLPSLVQGVIILMAGLIAGDYVTDRMKKSKGVPFANTLAIIVEIFIAYNALVIALPMLLPASDPSLLVWSFLVVLSALALAVGLGAAIAIGLGMKDVVAELAKKHKSKLDGLF
ncbi:MAG: hypothetical protein N3E51_01535 [Candidatus Micrarchaeota archaeon]|nr:hypothetical protein [Candidatus Micrarchaeota archaeon]